MGFYRETGSNSDTGYSLMTDSAKIPQNIDSGIGRLRADSFRVASFGEGFMWCWHALLSLKTSLFWAVLLIIIISVGVSSALPVPGLTTLITFVFSGIAASYALQYGFRKGLTPAFPDTVKALKTNFWNMLFLTLWDIVIWLALVSGSLVLILLFFGSGTFEILSQLWTMLEASANEAGFSLTSIAGNNEVQKIPQACLIFVHKLLADAALVKTLLFYGIIYFLAGSLVALIMYSLEFFSVPLVMCSGMPALRALWESFKAFSLNIMSITGMCAGYLVIWLIFNSVWLFLGFIAPPLMTFSIFGMGFTTLFVGIFHILIRVNATKDVFWYRSFEESLPLYKEENSRNHKGPQIATADFPETKELPRDPE